MNKKFYSILLAFLFLAVGTVQATKWTVTTTADNATTPPEGSLRKILTTNVQDGDTVVFANELATETIELTTDITLFGANANAGSKTLTILGNGVTIAGDVLMASITNGSYAMAKLEVENIRFKNSGIASYVKTEGHIRNCSFDYKNASLLILAFGGNYTIEGCAFTTETEGGRAISINLLSAGVSFVSCTFVKAANSSVSGAQSSIFSAYSITLTNCVVMDNSSQATFNKIPASNGYNVIRANGSNLGNFTEAGDVVLAAEVPQPLTLDGDVWKAPLSSPAYRHLPPAPQWADNDKLQNVVFPLKDLSGAGIDYTCKTHSGAWQTAYLADGETELPKECVGTAPTGVVITPPAGTVYTETGTYAFTAVVSPGDASQAVVWTSSDNSIATIAPDGNKGILTPVAPGQVTLTAASKDYPAVSGSVTVDVTAYPHVTGIALEVDTIRTSHHQIHRIYAPAFTPADALNKEFDWTFEESAPGVIAHTTILSDLILQGIQAGTVKVIATAKDGGAKDSCVVIFNDPDYTDGVFMVTEGNYPGEGQLNFLHPDGRWDYNVYTAFNNPMNFQTPTVNFGVTSQYGTIYGDKFYVISKQGARLVVFDPVTIKRYKAFRNLPAGDGRAFLGVDEHTGYISSSNGISVINLDDMSGGEEVISTLPGTVIEGTQSGSGLYTGQIGTMIRVGERVFAVSQSKGLVVINPATHRIDTVLDTYHYAVLAQSYDGYLWAGATVTESTGNLGNPSDDSGQGGMGDDVVTYNALIRIDPWTLEEKPFPLPDGIGAPPSTWSAWQADPLVGSPTENALYWKEGSKRIHRYDIATGQVTTVFNTNDYAVPPPHNTVINGVASNWNMYGPSFRIHPVTGDLYVWITLFHLQAPFEQRMVWEVYRINPVTGEQLGYYPLKDTYWWPSLFVFPDNAAPAFDASFPATRTLNATNRYDTLALRPLVTDADQMSAAIVKTITAISDRTLIDAFIRHDTLFITPLQDVTEAKSATLSLKFNSNGKVITRDLTVTVEPGAIAHPVTGLTLNHTTAGLPVGETLALTATIAPANADNKALTWTSSQPLVASVDANGLVTAHLAPATVVITATSAEGGFTATCTITVVPEAVQYSLRLNHTVLVMNEGDRTALQATVSPAGDQPVTWQSSQPTVADVTSDGTVLALSPGSASITASLSDGTSASCSVTVRDMSLSAQISDITADGATLSFPKLSGTSYYLIHLFEVSGGQREPVAAYKINPDGTITGIVGLRASDNNIHLKLTGLKSSTLYEATIDVVREIGSVDETVSVFEASFTTSYATGIESPSAGNAARVWYADGALHLKNLEGYVCRLTSISGQVLKVITPVSQDETSLVSLPSGVYILAAQKENAWQTVKVAVF